MNQKDSDRLDHMEKNQISSISVEDSVLRYKFNRPTITISNFDVYKTVNNERIYNLPRYGDLLLDITILGGFSHAEMYQYDDSGSRIIYDTLIEQGTMIPFISSGFPLLNVGKGLWLSIYDEQEEATITITYALLESSSRKLLSNYKSSSDTGVVVRGSNGKEYIVIGVQDYGYSPNYLAVATESFTSCLAL